MNASVIPASGIIPADDFVDLLTRYDSQIEEKLVVKNELGITLAWDDLTPDMQEELHSTPQKFLEDLKSYLVGRFKILHPELVEDNESRFPIFAARIKGLPKTYTMRELESNLMEKFVETTGIIVSITSVLPMVKTAYFRCVECNDNNMEVEQDELNLKYPKWCGSPKDIGNLKGECRGKWELVPELSKFENTQIVSVQEHPEDVGDNMTPVRISLRIPNHLINTAFAGDRVKIVGIFRAVVEKKRSRICGRTIVINNVEVLGEDVRNPVITDEDMTKIIELKEDKKLFDKLTASIAPSIFGNEDVKLSIAALMVGGMEKTLADKSRIRGTLSIILIGDPGCLVAEERVILGDGGIMKIGDFGEKHLDEINTQIQTRNNHRNNLATTFFKYEKQPIIEVITETGKNIRGTHNHPLLFVDNKKGYSAWRRLDEFKIGDRVKTITMIPCSKTTLEPTNFKPHENRFGPHFKGKLPSLINEDLSAFYGYCIGDGWVSKTRIGYVVSEKDMDVLPKINNIVENIFGIIPYTRKYRGVGRKEWLYCSDLNSMTLVSNMKFLARKRIPEGILLSGNKVVSSFLKWLFEADGSVFDGRRGHRGINLKAKDVELLRDVQILLLRFGIHSRINENALLIRRGFDIIRFAENIGFVSKRKIETLDILKNHAKIFARVKQQRSERIVRINHLPLEDVYDIEVPQSHSFIANGIVSHNSAKTAMLKYVYSITPRGVYAAGKGASGVGLTAAVIKQEDTGQFALEAGAMVLANGGIACMSGDTGILTDDDYIKAEKIWDEGIITNDERRRLVYYLIPSWGREHKESKQLLYEIIRSRYIGKIRRITMSNGLTLSLTPEHRIFTGNKCKPHLAGELNAGQKMFMVDFGWSEKTIDLGADKAYLYGMIYGDGYVTKNGITISQSANNGDIINKIQNIESDIRTYIKTPKERILNGKKLLERAVHLWYNNKGDINEYMNGFSHCQNILKLSYIDSLSFLGGLFDADGCINHNHGQVIALKIFPSNDKYECEKIIMLLKRLRVDARIQNSSIKKRGVQEISISGNNICKLWDLLAPFSVKIRRGDKPRIRKHKDGIPWSEITNIIDEDYDGYVYDVNVLNTHTFIANGVLIHNCLDEFDKISTDDRNFIHEPLANQTVTINKGGINVTLNAKCAVLAAANPRDGRYNYEKGIRENISFPPTLLTRFDLIWIIKDIPQIGRDQEMTAHILKSHTGGENIKPPIDTVLLQKYFSVARKIKPKLTEKATQYITAFYMSMRNQSSGNKDTPMSITPRQLETTIRLSEAMTKLRLSENVEEEDVIRAIDLLGLSFQQIGYDPTTGEFDIDLVEGVCPRSDARRRSVMVEIIRGLTLAAKPFALPRADVNEIISVAEEKYGMEEGLVNKTMKTLSVLGVIIQEKMGEWKLL